MTDQYNGLSSAPQANGFSSSVNNLYENANGASSLYTHDCRSAVLAEVGNLGGGNKATEPLATTDVGNKELQTPTQVLKALLGDLFLPPDQLVFLEQLGEGSFATVHKCEWLSPARSLTGTTPSVGKLRTYVAVKKMRPNVLIQDDDFNEFIAEAAIMRKMKHPHITRIYGVGASDLDKGVEDMRRSMYIVMEMMEGGDLRDKVLIQMTARSKIGLYPKKEALKWCMEISSALNYMHNVCRPIIIHRDLKLENLFLARGEDGEVHVKLGDFGLHKRAQLQVEKNIMVSCKTHWGSSNPFSGLDKSYYGGGGDSKRGMKFGSMRGVSLSARGMKKRDSSTKDSTSPGTSSHGALDYAAAMALAADLSAKAEAAAKAAEDAAIRVEALRTSFAPMRVQLPDVIHEESSSSSVRNPGRPPLLLLEAVLKKTSTGGDALSGGGAQHTREIGLVPAEAFLKIPSLREGENPPSSLGDGRLGKAALAPKAALASSLALRKSDNWNPFKGVTPNMVDATRQVGSLMYMAPEVYNGFAYNEKVDVFSFGVIMYELMTGRLLAVKAAFNAELEGGLASYVDRVSEGYRERLPSTLHPQLVSLIERCWHQTSSMRPGFDHVLKELTEMYGSADSFIIMADPSCGCTLS